MASKKVSNVKKDKTEPTIMSKLISSKNFNVSLFIFVFAAMAASLILYSNAAPKPRNSSPVISIYLSPSSERMGNGQQYTLSIYEDSLNTAVNAVQANVTYDPTALDVVSVDSTTSPFDVKAQSNVGGGTINIALGHIGSLVGKQLVANVVVKPKKSNGKTQLNFVSGTSLVSTADNTNVLQKTTGGSYSLSH